MVNEHFFPQAEPYATGELAVEGPHVLYWEECGTPAGEPIVFLHGGPGMGSTATDRRFFAPDRFRAVLFDQRGCGRSRPVGELEGNDPDALVRDIERLREARGVERWHVFGGSWGSSLALHYAESHPASVKSLVLRGIWLLRAVELQWWLYTLRWLRPEAWKAFAEHLPEDERGDLLEGYWRRLTGPDHEVAVAAAKRWSVYEGSACTLLPNEEFASAFEDAAVALPVARLEAHWFRNVGFDPDTLLLDRVDRIRGIPAFAVHGRYDVVCPVGNLFDLAEAWPELDAVVVEDAGHSSHEPGITRELVAATNRIARTGDPRRAPTRG